MTRWCVRHLIEYDITHLFRKGAKCYQILSNPKWSAAQGSTLGPRLYLLYNSDIPTTEKIVIGAIVNATIIKAPDASQENTTEKQQVPIDKINQWTGK